MTFFKQESEWRQYKIWHTCMRAAAPTHTQRVKNVNGCTWKECIKKTMSQVRREEKKLSSQFEDFDSMSKTPVPLKNDFKGGFWELGPTFPGVAW